jgi:hypothetical protein
MDLRQWKKVSKMKQMTTNPHKCLLCDRNKESRGLCPAHYQQFRRQRDKLPPEEWAAFEQILIDRGQLLAETDEIVKVGNPFNQALIEFRKAKAEKKPSFAEEVEALNEQVAEETKAIRRRQSQKPTVHRTKKSKGKRNGTD